MKYDKCDRQAIKSLSSHYQRIFKVFERREQGEISGIPELCNAIERYCDTYLFSCVSGNGEIEKLDANLGVLFSEGWKKRIRGLQCELQAVGGSGLIRVVVDDTEPVRVWQWGKDQCEITHWYRKIIAGTSVPQKWIIELWSDVESNYLTYFDSPPKSCSPPRYRYEDVDQIVREKGLLSLHHLVEHMRRHPNKKLGNKQNIQQVALRRAVQYRFQGIVLKFLSPHGMLIQTETPSRIKDPLYGHPSESLPIVHPFSEERR
ncbi:MAG: hypothetical protein A2664_03225 [Candidatus Taylorbacteria bacterium RIFCSPHIGHO2_01_FULL_46_22b]|uniref:Uncharacterized protein n=1 Tax=Candidatus Taylorbacteria bacterium RIFCSPHIGHO2_01_FULL_46_22b TaxID=1802301 RepID=A0A1G2M168_9BACT|nr:MAG: hypothetical protein A2664_03225 [Candidatus Taylorbacteria bacterium RIFCSPHIGHO2_01_FULL_46_22b]